MAKRDGRKTQLGSNLPLLYEGGCRVALRRAQGFQLSLATVLLSASHQGSELLLSSPRLARRWRAAGLSFLAATLLSAGCAPSLPPLAPLPTPAAVAPYRGRVAGLVLSADGAVVAIPFETRDGGGVAVLDGRDGRLLSAQAYPGERVERVALSSDGARLLTLRVCWLQSDCHFTKLRVVETTLATGQEHVLGADNIADGVRSVWAMAYNPAVPGQALLLTGPLIVDQHGLRIEVKPFRAFALEPGLAPALIATWPDVDRELFLSLASARAAVEPNGEFLLFKTDTMPTRDRVLFARFASSNSAPVIMALPLPFERGREVHDMATDDRRSPRGEDRQQPDGTARGDTVWGTSTTNGRRLLTIRDWSRSDGTRYQDAVLLEYDRSEQGTRSALAPVLPRDDGAPVSDERARSASGRPQATVAASSAEAVSRRLTSLKAELPYAVLTPDGRHAAVLALPLEGDEPRPSLHLIDVDAGTMRSVPDLDTSAGLGRTMYRSRVKAEDLLVRLKALMDARALGDPDAVGRMLGLRFSPSNPKFGGHLQAEGPLSPNSWTVRLNVFRPKPDAPQGGDLNLTFDAGPCLTAEAIKRIIGADATPTSFPSPHETQTGFQSQPYWGLNYGKPGQNYAYFKFNKNHCAQLALLQSRN